MIEIFQNLFVGTERDYESTVKGAPNWCVVHACKEPYHRRELGYKTRGAPKEHPEYLIAYRDNRLILNLVDAGDPDYIAKEVIDAALDFIKRGLADGRKVFVHCNLGESRAPSIALLYLAIHTNTLSPVLVQAEKEFRQLYPPYNPGTGMTGFIVRNWNVYLVGKQGITPAMDAHV